MKQRVWVYTISRLLNQEELLDLATKCRAFVSTWTAHDISLDATFEIYKNRLLIIKVNEEKYNASGCSIDKQLRFIKELENQFQVEMLNRLLVAFQNNNEVDVVKPTEIRKLLDSGKIDEETIVYNNTITDSIQLSEYWKIPLKNSWLNKYLKIA